MLILGKAKQVRLQSNPIAKSLAGNCLALAGNLKHERNEIVVVFYHSTQKQFIPNFERQLDFYERNFEIVDTNATTKYYLGHDVSASGKPRILLTFDDGIKNNLFVVDSLNRRNLRALFFVIPGFIETRPAEQKDFFLTNVRPNPNLKLDRSHDDVTAMTWSDLSDLLKVGHAIGSHTYNHNLKHELSSLPNSQYEIVHSKLVIETNLNCLVSTYASPIDTLLSTGHKELDLIRRNYSLHFSTVSGSNNETRDPYFIKRVNAEAFWPLGAVKYSVGKFHRGRWKNQERQFQTLLTDAQLYCS